MNIYKRLQFIAVLHAIFILVFSILQALVNNFNYIDTWFHSIPLQIAGILICWVITPFIFKIFTKDS